MALFPLMLCGIVVACTWNENYGDSKINLVKTFSNAWKVIKEDRACLWLGLG